MQTASVIEIPTAVWESADTLNELEDWLMANNPGVMRELRHAQRKDLAGKFKPLRPRHLPSKGTTQSKLAPRHY